MTILNWIGMRIFMGSTVVKKKSNLLIVMIFQIVLINIVDTSRRFLKIELNFKIDDSFTSI